MVSQRITHNRQVVNRHTDFSFSKSLSTSNGDLSEVLGQCFFKMFLPSLKQRSHTLRLHAHFCQTKGFLPIGILSMLFLPSDELLQPEECFRIKWRRPH